MYRSRIPRIAAEIDDRMDAAVKAAAETVERRAKDRVPVNTGRLKAAIHTERRAEGEYEVIAGDSETFYGHIVEHGGAHSSGRPFLAPAAEDTRAELDSIGRQELRGIG